MPPFPGGIAYRDLAGPLFVGNLSCVTCANRQYDLFLRSSEREPGGRADVEALPQYGLTVADRPRNGRSTPNTRRLSGRSLRVFLRPCLAATPALLAPRRLLRRLHRWANDRSVRAKHTAVTCFRPEQHPAADAVVKELAGIRRHGRRVPKSAVWAS